MHLIGLSTGPAVLAGITVEDKSYLLGIAIYIALKILSDKGSPAEKHALNTGAWFGIGSYVLSRFVLSHMEGFGVHFFIFLGMGAFLLVANKVLKLSWDKSWDVLAMTGVIIWGVTFISGLRFG